ncbi:MULTISPECIES: TonB family protein [Acidithiobacillus]|uniref:TonB family protein n=1 Tax=Acidithiobacillus caldus (strain ATCC 51756 / DSM 8584 / KU) TaxID=637389 RepID=A0A059ZP76_ACICK|nr:MULTISPECIES: TonB family protein [Acidithiobacillus]AIA54739.1 TonB family protein [Acidithiobacillus caldus ATCC 51756]MBU2731086.1 TonB family protein [Acidithiobacillus caldus]MBU2735069.1 TonB family protein [Acidithiobacillus caldus ATCC 51756]MBU2746450.1 TonB family protein [Acidithiobacillus caldus]MBU2764138.1 TonB family protein [Acidithiobacillus caldus]
MLSAERPFFFLVPEEKPHWSESLLPWLVLSAALLALFLALWVHVAPPHPLRLKSNEIQNKTFQIMPQPAAPSRPSVARPKAVPPARTTPKTELRPEVEPRPTVKPRPRVQSREPVQPQISHTPAPRPLPRPNKAPATPASTPSARAETAPPRINLGTLEQQMDQAARQATASPPLPKFKNPTGPVADFYIAGWIQKLERIGDLNYPGEMVGNLKVTVVLNPKGDLERIVVDQSSGNPALDAAAERIIRLSFPYTPFSEQLRKQTRRIEIPLNMHFLGVRHVSAW